MSLELYQHQLDTLRVQMMPQQVQIVSIQWCKMLGAPSKRTRERIVELLAHPQYREEEAQTEPTNVRHSVVQTNQHFNPSGGRVAPSTLDPSTGDYAELVHQPTYANHEVDTIPRDINAPLYEVPYSGGGFSLSRFLGGH